MKAMEDKKISVLYLDDEANNLKAFVASFRRHFNIYPVSSAEEAYKVLEENTIHVAISDQRMPGITGVEFFETIRIQFPYIIRILLTAYSNLQTIIDAVNKGKINQYVVKPWDTENLKSIIETAYNSHLVNVELSVANEALRKTNDELNRFVYSASHDLRAPLMSILGLVQMARLDTDNDNPTFYLDKIEQSVSKLDAFIIRIIDYYRNSRTESDLKQIDLSKLTHEVINTLKDTDPSTSLKLTIEQGLPFVNDEFRIRVILANLISNAYKFRSKINSSISISISSSSTEAIIEINDNGIGIQKEDIGLIFDMFFRSRSANTAPGSGIGLYVVKEALKKIDGEITVKSELGLGSVFVVKIPNLAANL